ncbi:phage head closure protein [Rhizobium sp. RAF56]|jgi:SPP1 family predicted phage head-tail adaptor|uniref:phage head closure protein n=1 Tax=Rhizobium sp. RAF56 TaxID=3233062 RepID=UPI003F9617EB
MRSTFFDPGRMTARLALEAPVATPDGQGGASIAFEERASAWALVEPVAVAIEVMAGSETFTRTHRIWLRWRTDITAGMRLRKGARLFLVGALEDPDESRRYLICHCEEKNL